MGFHLHADGTFWGLISEKWFLLFRYLKIYDFLEELISFNVSTPFIRLKLKLKIRKISSRNNEVRGSVGSLERSTVQGSGPIVIKTRVCSDLQRSCELNQFNRSKITLGRPSVLCTVYSTGIGHQYTVRYKNWSTVQYWGPYLAIYILDKVRTEEFFED